MSFIDQCMVVNLKISVWTGQRLDKEASERVTTEAQAHEDAARVNKHLIPREVLSPITKAQTQLRAHFYKMTLPWKDNGDRVLTRKLFGKFMEEHQVLANEFKDAVTKFITEDYPRARDQAAFRMGALFNPNDYPSPYVVERRFHVGFDIDPVSAASDFRVQLSDEELEKVQGTIERAMKERVGRAMTDVWDRMFETLGHYATTMADPEKVFRDTTVRNLQELADMLPAFNILEDKQLDAIRQKVQHYLSGIEPKELRNNPATRASAAADAQRIIDEMSGFMNAFKGVKHAA
jgi:hypothetical protein